MWYEIGCRERILHWRQWRESLNDLSWEQALLEVAKTWAKVPRVNHYLIPDEIDKWPTPWELIDDDIYCDLSVALGMFYTLSLTDFPQAAEGNISIYNDIQTTTWYNLSMFDEDKSVLNWDTGAVVNIAQLPTMTLSFRYTKKDFIDKLS